MGDIKDDKWKPNPEYLQTLVSMGIPHNIAIEALFCTGNRSLDDAVNYIFNFQENEQRTGQNSTKKEPGGEIEASDNSDDESLEDEANIKFYKMIFVVNTSLKMGVGKIAAQVGHACLGLYRELSELNIEDDLKNWEYTGEKKIVLKGNDTGHLQELFEKAKSHSIPCYLVRDAGHTQVAPNSTTVLSLFGLEDDVNKITGKLTLL